MGRTRPGYGFKDTPGGQQNHMESRRFFGENSRACMLLLISHLPAPKPARPSAFKRMADEKEYYPK